MACAYTPAEVPDLFRCPNCRMVYPIEQRAENSSWCMHCERRTVQRRAEVASWVEFWTKVHQAVKKGDKL